MADPMSPKKAYFLVSYLLIATIVTGCAFYGLSAAKPTLQHTPDGPNCGKDPSLASLYPSQVNVGSPTEVLLSGCQFDLNTTKLKVNGTLRSPLSVDFNHIRVGLTSADVASTGTVVITLANGDTEFGSQVLNVAPPTVDWKFFGRGPWNISQDAQVLLMILFIGAFGSCIYALKSLADYEGDAKLYGSWFIFYLIQPFEGAGIALLLYLAIRGGFLIGAGSDLKAVNSFGMYAIAGLAGCFSDTAFLKLREVFQILFKPKDDRGGKDRPVSIVTNALSDGVVGAPYRETLQTNGGAEPLQWSVTPSLPATLVLDKDTGVISGTPTAVMPKTPYTFTVADSATPATSASKDVTLEIKPAPAPALMMVTADLPHGVVGAAYQHTLQANGGAVPLQWSVTPALPAPLVLDKDTGVISGTPSEIAPATTYTFTVTDSATPAVAVTGTITLEIKPPSDGPPPPDSEDLDGCDVPVTEATSDVDLPVAEGGVA